MQCDTAPFDVDNPILIQRELRFLQVISELCCICQPIPLGVINQGPLVGRLTAQAQRRGSPSTRLFTHQCTLELPTMALGERAKGSSADQDGGG